MHPGKGHKLKGRNAIFVYRSNVFSNGGIKVLYTSSVNMILDSLSVLDFCFSYVTCPARVYEHIYYSRCLTVYEMQGSALLSIRKIY